MTLEKLTLTLNPSGTTREYEISMIESVEINSTKEAFSIAPPGLAASDNLLLGISGMQADISITWNIYNDGTDKADGTHTSTVKTVEEQITYLEETIHDPDFSASWQLTHDTGSAFASDEVFVESIDLPVLSLESPKWRTAQMTLRRGSAIA
jgi:hypothetical protein